MERRIRTDWVLFYVAVAMLFFGVLMVYSASSITQAQNVERHNSLYYAWRQAAWALAAVASFLAVRHYDYRRLAHARWAFPALSVAMCMVLSAYVVGDSHHRWIRLGPVGFQPSEFAKPALVLFAAWMLSRTTTDVNRMRTLLPAALAMGPLIVAVVIADLGTGFVMAVTTVALFWMAGLHTRYLVAAGLMLALLSGAVIYYAPWRLVRLVAFLGTDHPIVRFLDRDGSLKEEMLKTRHGVNPNYQLDQSILAVGSGGIAGRGLGEGVQKIFYLPEAHTDFILSVIAEELGFLGAAGVLLGYLMLGWRGFRLALLAREPFGRHLALGVTTMIVLQAFFNMSVVLGLAPTKGITLPLISYGGSSLVACMVSLGLVSSVSEYGS